MTSAELIERFSKTPLNHKVAYFALISVFMAVVFYLLFYSEVEELADQLTGQITTLEAEKADYEEKQRKYNSFRAKVSKLLQEQKELIKVLPTSAEIPSFLQSIHSNGELAGLNILTFEQQAEVPQEFYAKIPVSMGISGTFHQVNKFFYSVGNLKRIVNIKEVKLENPEKKPEGVLLKASFIATTYRFIEPATTGQQPPAGHGEEG